MHLYSVFDSLAERWHAPYCIDSDAVAQRSFMASVENSPIASNPGDFALFRIGDFDPTTGLVAGEISPVRIMSGFEAVHVIAASKDEDDKRQLSLA